MNTWYEIIQSIMALGIIIFSLLSTYYGIRVLVIHVQRNNKLLSCCWITLIQVITQLAFAFIFIFILEELLIKGVNVITVGSFGSLFIRPIIFLNNVTVSVYLKTRFMREKNITKVEDYHNEQ